ncbi:MAG: GPW/gp25 family protein [Chitinophagaceae bacterium]|nr:GPW/gp25 family protein [Chitinophagaceae bacterium]
MSGVGLLTKDWQISLEDVGLLKVGLDDIRQCIKIILFTRKGEDPLRPHFGCGISDWLDFPVNMAIPHMKKEILAALRRYEKRIRVRKITHEIKGSNVFFFITYSVDDRIDEFSIDIKSYREEQGSSGNILSAIYIPDAFRYYFFLEANGASTPIEPPAAGFTSIQDAMTWVNSNWYLYGKWFHIPHQSKVMLFADNPDYHVNTFQIESSDNILSAVIPILNPGEFYIILFSYNGNLIEPQNGSDVITAEDILQFVSSNYGNYGQWSVEPGELTLKGSVDLTDYNLEILTSDGTGAFSDGFNIGFDI